MEMLVYSLKVSALLIAFYLLFRSFMSRETLHRANRFLVLGSILLSFLLPFGGLMFQYVSTGKSATYAIAQPVIMLEEVIVGNPTATEFDWRMAVVVVFYLGIVVCLVRMALSIVGVVRVIAQGEHQKLSDGSTLVIVDNEQAPFSWIKYIVINRKDYDDSSREIITHEQAHIRCMHSVDVLVCDVLCCLQWYNPAMWLLRQELCALHEYEADKAVLDSGINAKQYQILLIKKAAGGKWYSIANSFNHSKLKYRITMMSRKKSSVWTLAKALYVLPIAAFAVVAFANSSCSKDSTNMKPSLSELGISQADYDKIPANATFISKDNRVFVKLKDGSYEEKEPSLMKGENADVVSTDEVFMIVEEMPKFPGGDDALRAFISENIVYPEDAKENQQEGKVYVTFIIDKEGKVGNVKLLKGTGIECLDNEAMRVISLLPQWTPGRQRGEVVNVSFNIPINFTLN
ncbi:MAG: M56 family metallopeptidase [Salinivirgaceae bacterium]|nr:M56 family metallopeptidase [Salinivirgaceae bacterium]